MNITTKLVEGKIPAGTPCPFRSLCRDAPANCNHRGEQHPIPYSCGTARAFDIFLSLPVGSQQHNPKSNENSNMKPSTQRLIKAFSDAIPLGMHPNPHAEFISVRLDFVQEAIAELQRLQLHEQANKVWMDKTDWAQDTMHPNELGMHRADGLKQRIENLQASNAELLEALKLAEDQLDDIEEATKFDERQISDWRPRVRDAQLWAERSDDAIKSFSTREK